MSSSSHRLSVLVVDDHEHTATGLTAYLAMQGYDAISANSGDEALMLAEKNPPACAILDIRMPGMNGVDLGRELRKRFRGDITLIGMSGADDKSLDYTLMLALCDFMMPKPLDVDRLMSILSPTGTP